MSSLESFISSADQDEDDDGTLSQASSYGTDLTEADDDASPQDFDERLSRYINAITDEDISLNLAGCLPNQLTQALAKKLGALLRNKRRLKVVNLSGPLSSGNMVSLLPGLLNTPHGITGQEEFILYQELSLSNNPHLSAAFAVSFVEHLQKVAKINALSVTLGNNGKAITDEEAEKLAEFLRVYPMMTLNLSDFAITLKQAAKSLLPLITRLRNKSLVLPIALSEKLQPSIAPSAQSRVTFR